MQCMNIDEEESVKSDLAEMLVELGVETISKAHKVIARLNIFDCVTCIASFDNIRELRTHLREQPECHYGKDRLREDRRNFNRRVGCDPDAPLKNWGSYESTSPATKRMFYRLLARKVVHITLR
eukprot:CAMPEP_0182826400 /NCGR_PEP_ID=MMETSP0006_2-20121128/16353_1 /TAXON_ID=97485 /ORGANISM="Prymnesium parvum, Strain Texoma1" /LENGTH=123 /DNA_ID=CAMNT_0024953561 /DNA_START=94 /DNA_END=465 /DNA_ORIENTATION=+